jgi:hypothetical protein
LHEWSSLCSPSTRGFVNFSSSTNYSASNFIEVRSFNIFWIELIVREILRHTEPQEERQCLEKVLEQMNESLSEFFDLIQFKIMHNLRIHWWQCPMAAQFWTAPATSASNCVASSQWIGAENIHSRCNNKSIYPLYFHLIFTVPEGCSFQTILRKSTGPSPSKIGPWRPFGIYWLVQNILF